VTSVNSIDGLDEKTAAVVVQSPNFLGCVEDIRPLADRAHAVGALLIVVVPEAISLESFVPRVPVGLYRCRRRPVLGVPLLWRPYLGLLHQGQYARQIPGRLVGEAFDKQGRRGFVLRWQRVNNIFDVKRPLRTLYKRV